MEPLIPDRTALLIVDVQIGLFQSEPPPFAAAEVINNINELASKARQAGALVVFFQHDGSPEDGIEPESQGWQLDPRLRVASTDHVLRKAACDAFYRTELKHLLSGAGVETVVLAGYATDFCIDATVRNATSRDLNVIVAADAHTTQDGPVIKAEQARRHFNWAWENCTSRKPVHVTPSRAIQFESHSSTAQSSAPSRIQG
jgi:nicotinamidase-related amidase